MTQRAVQVMLRVTLGIPLIVALILMVAVGFNFGVEPIHDMTTSDAMTGAEDGFGAGVAAQNTDVIMTFAAVGLVSMVLVVALWMIIGDLTADVRQRQIQRRPPPP